ncbi:MAG: DegT/DnrJ/EryC1/StrS family aminotransferase [Aphanocapsa feldmannii 288cV]|nr:MAG: DegT/DnrJ/EryC1/StrS family aminotransferase [Aphanocapsa feldmannii 288cV]
MQVPPFDLSGQIADLGEELDQAVLSVLRSGQYIGGGIVSAFEAAFAASCTLPHVVGCNSGTDALILALRGLGIGPGDAVITASFSFFATAEAISAVGATPVFVDVDPATYLVDLEQMEAAIGPATRALLPVHLFGRPVDMERVCAMARRHGLQVVEDCAQACGAHWAGQAVGSWGDAAAFSFFPTKNLGAAGDGGAVACRDAAVACRVRQLAIHGMPERYLHTELGLNSRLDAIQAAVLQVKLPHLQRWLALRRSHAAFYGEALEGIQGVTLPNPGPEGHSWNQFTLRVTADPGRGGSDQLPACRWPERRLPSAGFRDQLQAALRAQGVNTIIYYPIPIHRQPAYEDLGYGPGSLPVSESLAAQVLSLPIFPELTPLQRQQVVKALRGPAASSTHPARVSGREAA